MSAERAAQLVEAGLWLQATGDNDGARRLFEQALKLDPGNPRAKQLLEPKRYGVPPRPPDPPPAALEALDPLPLPRRMYRRSDREEATEIDWGLESGEVWSPALNVELAPDALSAWDTKSNPGYDLGDIATPGPMRRQRDPLDLVAEGTPGPPMMPQAIINTVQRSEMQRRDEVNILLQGVKDLLELDDHSGAMELILRAQEMDPTNQELGDLRERSENTLRAMYESKLGDLTQSPRLVLKEDDIIWLNLDHRAGFVLAQIDGMVSFEDLFAVSGMSRLDTARILAQLVEQGVIRAA